ncbi:MAG: hypothetical protein HRT35_27905, partial [Algicola sp.]|nr:hypothetical protein [Algicola sp.]
YKTTLKHMGLNLSVEIMLRLASTSIITIILGFLAGLPPEAIALNAAITYILSIALEIPTGVYADRKGATKAVKLGCNLLGISMLAFVVCIMLYPVSASLMWLFLIVEAVLSAVGSALLSGAKEAFYQKLIDQVTAGRPEDEQQYIRTKHPLITEQFGKLIRVLGPTFLLLITMVLHDYYDQAFWIGILFALAWFGLALHYRYIEKHYLRGAEVTDAGTEPEAKSKAKAQTDQSIAESYHQMYNHILDSFKLLQGKTAKIGKCFAVNMTVTIMIHSYLLIDISRSGLFFQNLSPMITIAAVVIASSVGLWLRSIVLPFMAQKYSNEQIMRLCSFAQGCLLLMLLMGVTLVSHDFLLGFFCLYFLACHSLQGGVRKAAVGLLMDLVPAKQRATFLSNMTMIVMGAHGLLAAALFLIGVGTPGLVFTILLSVIGCLYVFINLTFAQQDNLNQSSS